MITLIQLEYIVALDTYRHFAKAAEKCFITQPTLSMQIKKLEEELELIIFDRSRQPLVPTDEGKQLIEQARIILQEVAKMNIIVDEIKDQVTGELRVGIIPTIAPYLLPVIAGKLKNRLPGLKLIFEEEVTEVIEEKLNADLLDLGIVVTPLKNDKFIEKPLYYEEIMLYISPGHYYSKRSRLRLDQIDPSDIWLLGDSHCFRHQVINFCRLNQLETSGLPYHFSAGSVDTLMRIVEKEGGYTLIPELAAMDDKAKERIKRFSDVTPLREVSLVYTRKYVKLKIIRDLARTIQSVVPEHMLQKERGVVVEWK